MDISLDDPSDHDPIQDLIYSDAALTESFESLKRMIDSHSAIQDFLSLVRADNTVSFEAAAAPLLRAVFAGTDIEVDRNGISLEAVAGASEAVVTAILSSMHNFFKALIDFYVNLEVAATWMMRKISPLETHAKAIGTAQSRQPLVQLGRQYRYLRMGAHSANEGDKLEAGLITLMSLLKTVSGGYQSAIVQAAAKLPSTTRGKSGESLQKALVQAIAAIPMDSIAAKCSMGAAPADRFNRPHVMTSGPLLGGYSLFYMKADLNTRGIAGFKFHGFTFDKTSRTELKVASHADLETLLPSQLEGIPSVVRDLLQTISKAANKSAQTSIVRSKSTLDNFIRSTQGDSADLDAIRKTVAALTHWMQQPSRAMMMHSMSVCRATISYCAASIKTYR